MNCTGNTEKAVGVWYRLELVLIGCNMSGNKQLFKRLFTQWHIKFAYGVTVFGDLAGQH